MYREEFRYRCHSCVGSRGLKGGPSRPQKSAFLSLCALTWEGPGDPGIGWLLTPMNIPPIGPALGVSRAPHHLAATEGPAYSYPVLWQFVVSDKKKTLEPEVRTHGHTFFQSRNVQDLLIVGGEKSTPSPIYLV